MIQMTPSLPEAWRAIRSQDVAIPRIRSPGSFEAWRAIRSQDAAIPQIRSPGSFEAWRAIRSQHAATLQIRSPLRGGGLFGGGRGGAADFHEDEVVFAATGDAV